MQAKGPIFLIIFDFVENHLLENTKLSFLVSWLQAKGLIFLIMPPNFKEI